MNRDAIIGSILGTAVGDALGLAREGMGPERAARMFKNRDRYHFFFSKGMVSDDTEHTCMVAQALVASAGEPKAFSRNLGRRFRFWLLGLPAGIGFATLRSLVKLWLGFSPERSGVFSAGNGPAMRSSIIGAAYGKDRNKLQSLVKAATHITHTDPKAYRGALAVALATHLNSHTDKVDGSAFLSELRCLLQDDGDREFSSLLTKAVKSAEKGDSTKAFVESMGLQKGITGYIYHTVPAVIHAWILNPEDFKAGMCDIIECGGDTDTTAAILGGIVGARVGKNGIPEKWMDNLIEWPRTVKWMELLAEQLGNCVATGSPSTPVGLSVPGVLLRNAIFMLIVLLHGFRRLLPPY